MHPLQFYPHYHYYHKKERKKEKIASLNTCEQLLSWLQIHANLNLKVNTMRGRLERRQKECKREEIEYKQGKII